MRSEEEQMSENLPICNSISTPLCTRENTGIEWLNQQCFCVSLNRKVLQAEVDARLDSATLSGMLKERIPHMFSALPVFISFEHAETMKSVIAAVESVVQMPAFKERILSGAPTIARLDPSAQSVFFGYDFHLGPDGPKLIEINTNAGGAILNAVLAKAQRACCAPVADSLAEGLSAGLHDQAFIDMFIKEWRHARRESPLCRIAIVDNDPPSQYLYPEFLLFQRLFQENGFEAVIADPNELEAVAGELFYKGKRIDLVYNRLTDFYFDRTDSAALRQAYLDRSLVVTPHPQAHALYANKRNLAIFSSREALDGLGVPAEHIEILIKGIPKTEIVTRDNADQLWSSRRRLFFKPAAGFGSKAAYRGDKLTKRVWQEILASEYVAQELVAPSERTTGSEAASIMKIDLRNYVYEGKVQLVAARLYQGQTTNFRTAGGGFAPVFTPGRSLAERTTAAK